MSELFADLRKFAKRQFDTLDLLPDYLTSVIEHWNDIFFSSIPMLPFVAWWYLGDPPMAIKVIVFLWVFVLAGYYAWRKEHLKNLSDDFRCWIYAMALSGDETAALLGDRSTKLFIGLRIVNVGPQTSIHTWQGGYRVNGRGIRFTDQFFHRGECGNLPDLIRGNNLHGDIRLLSQGETREGWIAIPAGDNPDHNVVREMMNSVSLGFTDAFDHFHEVSVLPELRRKSQ